MNNHLYNRILCDRIPDICGIAKFLLLYRGSFTVISVPRLWLVYIFVILAYLIDERKCHCCFVFQEILVGKYRCYYRLVSDRRNSCLAFYARMYTTLGILNPIFCRSSFVSSVNMVACRFLITTLYDFSSLG